MSLSLSVARGNLVAKMDQIADGPVPDPLQGALSTTLGETFQSDTAAQERTAGRKPISLRSVQAPADQKEPLPPRSVTGRLTVSIIVPAYNGGQGFQRCLRSLTQLVRAPEEVIIVADGDTGGGVDLARELGFTVLTLTDRGGPALARNRGAHAARGDLLFFVDADVTIPPDAVERVVAAFQAEPDLAAAFGSYDDSPAAGNFLSQYRNLLHHYIHQTSREDGSTFWSACGAIRRRAFLAIGGFDETYRRPCVEDIELGYRLRQAGLKVRLCKSLQAKHWKAWTAGSLMKTDFLYRAAPWTELIMRYRRFDNELNLRPGSRVSVVLACGLLGVIGALWNPWFLALAAACAMSLLAINAPLYRFFRRKRGLWFAIKAIPWHWAYYVCGGMGFAIGLLRYLLRRRGKSGLAAAASERPDPSPGRDRD